MKRKLITYFDNGVIIRVENKRIILKDKNGCCHILSVRLATKDEQNMDKPSCLSIKPKNKLIVTQIAYSKKIMLLICFSWLEYLKYKQNGKERETATI